MWYPHLVIFWFCFENKPVVIAATGVLTLWFIWTYYIWVEYGVRDMSDMTLGGKYKVGFKRMKADLGNPVMIFYPCDTSCESTSVNAYENIEMLLKGLTL
jgi:hypothetical protein